MDRTSYEFAGVRFTPAYLQIENLENGKKGKLSPIRSQFLLALVESYPQIVTYENLRRKVWVNESEISARFKHNVQSTKNGLIKSFETIEKKADFIKDAPGRGYFINVPVIETPDASEIKFDSENRKDVIPDSKIPIGGSGNYFGFAVAGSLFYGLPERVWREFF